MATTRATQGLCAACLLGDVMTLDTGLMAYDIVTVIGRDPGGVTYLAEARTRGRRVALKIVGPRPDVSEVLIRYDRVRAALEAIGHPGVRRLIDVGAADLDYVYLASEYVTGTSLADVLLHGTLSEDERAEIGRQVCDIVVAAHHVGLVHGSIDAPHVRITRSSHLSVKLFGLGTSQIVDGLDPSAADDASELANLARELHLAVPRRIYQSAAAIRDVLG